MKKQYKIIVGILVTVLCVLLATSMVACNKPSPKKNNTLIVGTTTTFESLDRRLADKGGSAGYNFDIMSASLSQLTPIYDENGQNKPLLCEIPTKDASSKTWTIKLNPGFKWHDGKPVTNQDIMFTLSKQYDEGTDYVNLEEKEGNVVITFKNANKKFLSKLLTLRVYPAHIFNVEDLASQPVEKTIIGCGPFKFISQDKEKGILVFEKFNDYPFADKITIEKVIIKSYGTSSVLAKDLQIGAVDLMYNYQTGLKKDEIMALSGKDGVKITSFTTRRMPKNLFFNNQRNINLKVKKAVQKAIDYEEVARIFASGDTNIGTEGFIPTTLFGKQYGARESKKLQRDLEGAKALLKEAGYSETNKLQLKLLINASNDDKNVSDIIIPQIEETGIIDVILNSSATFMDSLPLGDYDMCLMAVTAGGYTMAAGHATKYLLPQNSSVLQGNPVCCGKYEVENNGEKTRFGKIYEGLLHSENDVAYEQAIKDYQTFIEEETPVISLYLDSVSRAYRSDLDGFIVSGSFDIFNVKTFETLRRN